MVRISLDNFLKRHSISTYRLVKETQGRVARGSVYALARGNQIKRVDLDTLSEVLSALSRLTGQAVTPNDLLEVLDSREQAEARAQALELLSMDPWGKKPAGLNVPVPFKGEPFEVMLAEHRGPER